MLEDCFKRGEFIGSHLYLEYRDRVLTNCLNEHTPFLGSR